MDAEITSSGDVTVEGQHVGQLNGFRFTSDPQAAGEEARTLNAAAQKALASEIEGRATRVSEAVDEAFVLANDGLIRWLGEPVGRIMAGGHILTPQVRVIADEQLTGPALELVQRRLDLWLAQHVTKLLGPLAELEKGEGLDGIARGIAFQIAESLGVLERAKVADDVKNLPQEARGSLRKLGVRFGAYHLYLPALVKPAPRALSAQLWALKNGGVEGVKGLDEVPHLAASGRTSFVADQQVPKGFYRAAGFRVCGERAVRVDILERLADLIRPAIAYRPGTTPGDPPPGTADGDGFVVTVGMTSLAGCSGEAFGTILRSLGYVVDRRPGPAITVPLVAKAATEPLQPPQVTPAEATAAPAEDAAEPASAPATPVAAEPLEDRVSLARQSELIAAALEGGALEAIEPLPAAPAMPASAMEAPTPEPQAAHAEAAASEPAPVEASEVAAEPMPPRPADVEAAAAPVEVPVDALPETPAAEAAPASGEPEAESAPAEPAEIALIEVWRPHRHNFHNRRSADRNRGPRRAQNGAGAASEPGSVPGQGESGGEGEPRRDGGKRFGDRHGEGRPRGPRRDFAAGGDDRRPKPDFKGGKGPRRDERPRTMQSEPPRERERQPDPNSPFAKLAALKVQLEGK